MSQPMQLVELFFPKKGARGTAYAGWWSWWKARHQLTQLLQSDPSIVKGYSLTNGSGAWFGGTTANGAMWESDKVCKVSMLVASTFVQDFVDPSLSLSRPRQFLARIAKLSCIEMGQQEFWSVRNSGLVDVWTPQGLRLGPKVYSYDEILGSVAMQS